jgi:dTDP-glucose 4,6-dehydratase
VPTVLVTGGCGFIGSRFIRLLLSRTSWLVVNLDKLTYAGDAGRLRGIAEDPRYRFVQGDISDRGAVRHLLQQTRPRAVVNFAAESHVDRSILDAAPFVHTNVSGVQTLLDTSRAAGVERFLQISTDEVYGDREGLDPAIEQSALRPGSPYAATKAAADLLCLAAGRAYEQPVLIARSVNNYGPAQYPEKLIPLMVHHALGGRPLPVYGDGKQVRDWLHVDDACEALLRVLESGRPGGVYNVAGRNRRTNLEVIEALCRAIARETGMSYDGLAAMIRPGPDRPGHDRTYAISDDLLRAELGWQPRVAFDEGLAEVVRWYVQNRDWLENAFQRSAGDYFETVYVNEWGRRT